MKELLFLTEGKYLCKKNNDNKIIFLSKIKPINYITNLSSPSIKERESSDWGKISNT